MDICVTVPKQLWQEWLDEGDLPDDPLTFTDYHFWFSGPLPLEADTGSRCYIVAHGRLRGYAPLVAVERRCVLRPSAHCFMRRGGAVAVTIDEPIRGFQGWRYRFWRREDERSFPGWRTP
jgi:hypothetical protein